MTRTGWLRRCLADERGASAVEYVGVSAIMIIAAGLIIAAVYQGRFRLGAAMAAIHERQIASFEGGAPGTANTPAHLFPQVTLPDGTVVRFVPDPFRPTPTRAIIIRPDDHTPVIVRAEPWQRLDIDPVAHQVVLADPQTGREVRFDPQRWQAVALDPVTRVETPLTIMAFRPVNVADVLYAATGFAPDRLLEVRFVPGPVRPPRLALPVLGVPLLVMEHTPLDTTFITQ